MVTSYKQAGVDIDEGDRAVAEIRKMARATFTRHVLTDIGSFGACFQMPVMRKPVLISSVDGVGTKLKIAFATGRHDTVGEDLVNHCVNDIAVQGATPLFFLDYLAMGKLDHRVAASVVSGMARGCSQNGCSLIGGETAEMPGMYADGEYDLAGTIVGAAEKDKIITGKDIRAGNVLIALPSTGLHTNGYSLARKVLFEVGGYTPDSRLPGLEGALGDVLLKVHRSYLAAIQRLRKGSWLNGAAHITGGGITDNTPRMLPKELAAQIDTSAWQVPPIFEIMRKVGNIPEEDWRRTFNLGIGMIFAVHESAAAKVFSALTKLGEAPVAIGTVVPQTPGGPRVIYV